MQAATRRVRKRAALPGLASVVPLCLGGCLASVFEPAGARRVVAPPAYTVWWNQMEDCAGVTAPLDRIEWYIVRGEQFATPEGPRWGWWDPPHTIYIAQTHWWDEPLVEHEMLHDLLQTGAHPAAFQKCGVQEIGEATD
jgi:hypothetical protein